MRETHVTHIMAPDPVSVDVGQTLADVRLVLSSERFHHVPIVSEGKLVGLISSNDMIALTLGERDDELGELIDRTHRIEDVMQKDIITIGHRASVEEAAQLLSAGGFHALPVIDEQGCLKGILTSTDLIAFLLERPAEPEMPAAQRKRLELLEKVFKAAELYLHSGLAETEHSRLELAIEDVRRSG